jgi:PAS domain S-box-containing protein
VLKGSSILERFDPVIVAVVIPAFVVLVITTALHDYNSSIRKATEETRLAAHALAGEAEKALRDIDDAIRRTAAAAGGHRTSLTGLRELYLVAADGRRGCPTPDAAAARENHAGAPYFRVHLDDPDHGLFIGAPQWDARRAIRSFKMSRRIAGAAFEGVVVAIVDLEEIVGLSDTLRYGGDHVHVIGDDGALLAQVPARPAAPGREAVVRPPFAEEPPGREGTLRHLSLGDDEDFVFSYHRFSRLPLVVAVSRPEPRFMSAWWLAAGPDQGLRSATAILVVFIVALLVWLSRRRQAAEHRAATVEAQLTQALENITDGFTLFDADERLVLCNSNYRALYPGVGDRIVPGIRFEEIVRMVTENELIMGTRSTIEEEIAWRMAKFRNPEGPFDMRVSDGRWVRVSEYRTPDGRTVSLRSDVTALRQREAELRGSQQRFMDMVEAASDWFWEMDAELRYTYVSDRCTEITGIRPEAYVGKTGAEMADVVVDPDEARRHRGNLENRRPFRDYRFGFRRQDGVVRHITNSGKPVFDADGTFKGYRGTGTDITAQAEAEVRATRAHTILYEAIEAISEGFVLYDAQDRFVLCNTKYRERYPKSVSVLTPGTPFIDIIRAQIANGYIVVADGRVDDWIEERVAAHRAANTQIQRAQPDGRWISISEYRTGEGGRVGIFTDITEIKDKEKALNRRVTELQDIQIRLEDQGRQLVALADNLRVARDEAEHANHAKSAFLATMSHELRTPLNAVIGFSEVLESETFGPIGQPRYREYAADIHASGQLLLELINDILDLSKAEAGKLELQPEILRLGDVVEACLRLVKQRAHDGGLKVETEVSAELPHLNADRRKLKQILLNLLSNAVKFTPEGGVITVLGRRADDGGVEIVVADTGIGIAADDLAKAFETFGQVDSRLSRKYEGTGLGLPLVKALVELHGGTLDLESRLNIGTTATIRLPPSIVVPASDERRTGT